MLRSDFSEPMIIINARNFQNPAPMARAAGQIARDKYSQSRPICLMFRKLFDADIEGIPGAASRSMHDWLLNGLTLDPWKDFLTRVLGEYARAGGPPPGRVVLEIEQTGYSCWHSKVIPDWPAAVIECQGNSFTASMLPASLRTATRAQLDGSQSGWPRAPYAQLRLDWNGFANGLVQQQVRELLRQLFTWVWGEVPPCSNYGDRNFIAPYTLSDWWTYSGDGTLFGESSPACYSSVLGNRFNLHDRPNKLRRNFLEAINAAKSLHRPLVPWMAPPRHISGAGDLRSPQLWTQLLRHFQELGVDECLWWMVPPVGSAAIVREANEIFLANQVEETGWDERPYLGEEMVISTGSTITDFAAMQTDNLHQGMHVLDLEPAVSGTPGPTPTPVVS